MAETTTHSTEMTREEMADYLRSIADGLGSGSGSVRVPVGNKAVHLSPSDSIESEATVTERSRRLRKDTEEMVLRFKWNPVEDTAESDSGSAPPQDAESESGSGTMSGTDDDMGR